MNELQIMIRKQLSHPDLRYKSYGVLGSLALVRKTGAVRDGGRSLESGSSMKDHYHP